MSSPQPSEPTPAEREVLEKAIAQLIAVLFSDPQPQPGGNGNNERKKLALAIVSVLLGAGVPTVGAVQGEWNTAALAGVAFLLGVVLTALSPWGRK